MAAHFDVVWRALRRLGVPATAANDAAQLVFLHLAQRVESIERGKERAFAYSVAVRVAANVRRGLTRAQSRFCEQDVAEVPSQSADPEKRLGEEQGRRELDRILEAMADDLRTVFVLFELEGMSGPDIAETLGIPVGTVASRLRRAREVFHASVAAIQSSHRGSIR